MKAKNTLLLLIVAAVIFAFIQFYESKHNTTQQDDYEKTHLVKFFDEQDIDGISITNNEDKIELRRQQDGSWQVILPVKGLASINDRADAALVHSLIANLADLEVLGSFEADGKSAGTPSLKDVGLETPAVRVKLLGNGAPAEILFGKDTAVQGQVYARLDGLDTVKVVSSAVKTLAQKKADDFRDHRLMNFNPQLVDRLDVKTSAGEIEVIKDHGTWAVNKPFKSRADVEKIADLIAQTININIDSFLPENGANLATYGLAEPRGSISLSVEGSEKPIVLEIGQPVDNDKQKVYARFSTRESVYVLPEKINDVLFIKPNDVRDKHLLELNLDMVDRIHVQAAGKPELTIARKGEDWTLKSYGDAPANNSLIKNFVNTLRVMPVTAFVSDVDSDLPKYGLDKPQLRVTFSSYASENTAESAAGENAILTLAFGKIDGHIVYVRLENEPYVVAVPKGLFDVISPDPIYWEDLSIFKNKPEEIVSLQITRNEQTIDLERADNGTWSLAKSSGELNQIKIQSLVNTLATLSATRSLGSATGGLGFEVPSLVISFTTSGKKTGKLTIGSPNEEDMWNAEAEGRSGAFLISKPDYSALGADLTAPATSAAAPSAGQPLGAPSGVQ